MRGGGEGKTIVDTTDDVIEESEVKSFSQSVASVAGLVWFQWYTMEEGVREGGRVNTMNKEFFYQKANTFLTHLMMVPTAPPFVVVMTRETRDLRNSSISIPSRLATPIRLF